jgi:hypothetical protein
MKENTKCWIYHTWGKWEDLNTPSDYGHNHQVKECKQCGIKAKRCYSA